MSAVASVSTSGVLPTRMPRRVASATSMFVEANGVIADDFQLRPCGFHHLSINSIAKQCDQSIATDRTSQQIVAAWWHGIWPNECVAGLSKTVQSLLWQLASHEHARQAGGSPSAKVTGLKDSEFMLQTH